MLQLQKSVNKQQMHLGQKMKRLSKKVHKAVSRESCKVYLKQKRSIRVGSVTGKAADTDLNYFQSSCIPYEKLKTTVYK